LFVFLFGIKFYKNAEKVGANLKYARAALKNVCQTRKFEDKNWHKFLQLSDKKKKKKKKNLYLDKKLPNTKLWKSSMNFDFLWDKIDFGLRRVSNQNYILGLFMSTKIAIKKLYIKNTEAESGKTLNYLLNLNL